MPAAERTAGFGKRLDPGGPRRGGCGTPCAGDRRSRSSRFGARDRSPRRRLSARWPAGGGRWRGTWRQPSAPAPSQAPWRRSPRPISRCWRCPTMPSPPWQPRSPQAGSHCAGVGSSISAPASARGDRRAQARGSGGGGAPPAHGPRRTRQRGEPRGGVLQDRRGRRPPRPPLAFVAASGPAAPHRPGAGSAVPRCRGARRERTARAPRGGGTSPRSGRGRARTLAWPWRRCSRAPLGTHAARARLGAHRTRGPGRHRRHQAHIDALGPHPEARDLYLHLTRAMESSPAARRQPGSARVA